MAIHSFNLNHVDPSWYECLDLGIHALDPEYLMLLAEKKDWLPGPDKILSAFSIPIHKVNYVLFGESPYPRKESANGYAFWDAAVNQLWSENGLTKQVNRATSLRNFIKMLLVAEGCLQSNECTPHAISQLDKKSFVQTLPELFNKLLAHGFLLLNTTPVFNLKTPQQDARAWYTFTTNVLECLLSYRPHVKFLMFGRIAHTLQPLLSEKNINALCAEHPYNLSFINNKQVLNFFRPLHLLIK